MQLRRHPVRHSGRSDHAENAGPVQGESQHPVEPSEMVHVAVGHENMADSQDFPRRKRCEIAGIEQQGSPAQVEVNEQAGIAERIVHQLGPIGS